MRQDQLMIKQIENQLDKALVAHNDLRSQNKALRKEINEARNQQ